MGGFWSDIRYGWRILRRNPAFAMVAILTLAAGIGANAAIFSVVQTVLLQPLPFAHSDRLVYIWETDLNRSIDRGTASPAEYLDWRDMNHGLEQMAAFGARWVTLLGSGKPQQLWAGRTSSNFFRLFGVKPILGRDLTPEEDMPGHGQVVLISYGFWQKHYGGDPGIVGKTLRLSEGLYTIIGVLPRGFTPFGIADALDLWMPSPFDRAHLDRNDHELVIFGRLRPGVTLRQEQAEMETIQDRVKKEYPEFDQENGVRVVRMRDDMNRGVHAALIILAAVVGLVLLIACANVANLMLARAVAREREIAVRTTIGAGRLRIVRQLLTESMTLALIGGGLGILVGYGGLRLLLHMLPSAGILGEIPRVEQIHLNGPVLAFCLLITLATGFIFGLAPAIQVSRSALPETLKEGGRGSSAGRRSAKLRSALIVTEMAISVILLVAAGLLIRSFGRMMSTKLGFNPSHLLTAQLELPEAQYATPQKTEAFYQQVFDQLPALPGVKAASGVNYLPLTSWTVYRNFDIEGKADPPPGRPYTSQYEVVDWRYLRAMQTPLLEGRDFAVSDSPDSAGVAIINRALQQLYWSDQDPVGRRIRVHPAAAGAPFEAETREGWLTIVGVAGNTQDWQLGQEPLPTLYLPASQNPSRMMRLVLRTAGNPTSVLPSLKDTVASLDPSLPVTYVIPMDALFRDSVAHQRMTAILLGIFAALATLLAAVGIYGVMSYGVSQRTHEIGIRMAVGATPGDVQRMILADGMRLAGIGLALGVAGALGLVHYVQSQLYGVSDRDPLTFLCVAGGLLAIAAAACYLPARRATRVDPLAALREE